MDDITLDSNIEYDDNIFDELKDKEKVRVSITIDKKILTELERYKKENNIKELSPMINLMLKDWIKKNRGEKSND